MIIILFIICHDCKYIKNNAPICIMLYVTIKNLYTQKQLIMKMASLEEDIKITKEVIKRLRDAKREHSSRLKHTKMDIKTHCKQYESLSNEINVCRLLQDKFEDQYVYNENNTALIKCELEQITHIQDIFKNDLHMIQRDLKDQSKIVYIVYWKQMF